MIRRGLFLLTILSSCVLSLPVTSRQLENEDVKVMKCIVEALADVLSRPHPMPVSQECLVTLKTDDRLVTVLRHQNFLKEMQEIAAQGGRGRADTPTAAAPTLQATDDVPDRSMLEALGGPGERSILSKRTGNGKDEKDAGMEDRQSQGDNEAEEVQVKRESDESPGSHISESAEEWREGEDEKREEDEEGYDEKRAEENSEEESKDDGSDENRDTRRKKSKEETSDEEDEEEETTKRLSLFHKNKGKEEGRKEETKRGNRESLQRWTKATKPLLLKKKASTKEEQQEMPHHSKEMAEEEEEEKKKRNAQKSPEEKELQMIARRAPEERRGLEEEGSASRKSEEPEIESLAAIESELENVAQKLHELRRG
ncbi:chromogranin-A isoform X2 [Oreochromis niloticus]|uniref:Chromogranin-A n=1 Tax=Oreochromis niloticus TaxID=8128 RepID=I3IWC4_ORENI|nr:chromogranin-A isoform X2 [Oreochromis niloticus]